MLQHQFEDIAIMLGQPRADLVANTADYERLPLVRPLGFREYDARWLFGEEINLNGIQALGLGLGTYLHQQVLIRRLLLATISEAILLRSDGADTG